MNQKVTFGTDLKMTDTATYPLYSLPDDKTYRLVRNEAMCRMTGSSYPEICDYFSKWVKKHCEKRRKCR